MLRCSTIAVYNEGGVRGVSVTVNGDWRSNAAAQLNFTTSPSHQRRTKTVTDGLYDPLALTFSQVKQAGAIRAMNKARPSRKNKQISQNEKEINQVR